MTNTLPQSKPTRILALSGMTQNKHIYAKQLAGIIDVCDNVEFTFIDPPHIMHKTDLPRPMDRFYTTEDEPDTPETTPRAWAINSLDRRTYRYFDDTVAYCHEFILAHGPFDGIMGFSQGAVMSAILAALIAKPNLHQNWPSTPSIPQFEFVIAIGGFLPSADNVNFPAYFPLPASVPVLHVMGRTDVVVPEEKGRTLVDMCPDSRVEFHDGGHFTPRKASWRHFFRAYITHVAGGGDQMDVPSVKSFCLSGSNSPSSGGSSRSLTPDLLYA